MAAAQIIPIRRERPVDTQGHRLPPPFPLTMVDVGCGRDTKLHIDRLTSPDLLNKLWPWMRFGLMFIKHKNCPEAHWIPEHVRTEIVKGLSGQSPTECLLAHDAESDTIRGFLIVYPMVDPFIQIPITWFGWMSCLDHYVFDALLPEFEQMARDRGFLSWRLATSRKGYARRAHRVGAEVVEYIIQKRIVP